MKPYQVSNLARSLDPDFPTNRAVLILVPAISGLAAAYSWIAGSAVPEALLMGVRTGLASFTTWAITREIDPDHSGSAFLSMAFGTACAMLLPGVHLLLAFWLMALLRIINRTTGLPARWLDSLVIAGFSLWLLWSYDWLLGIFTGTVFFLDSAMSDPLPRHRYFGLAFMLLGVLGRLLAPAQPAHALDARWTWMAGASSLAFLPLLVHSARIESTGDLTGRKLDPHRVQAAQLLLILCTALLLARTPSGLEAGLLPLASILGAGLYDLGRSVWGLANPSAHSTP